MTMGILSPGAQQSLLVHVNRSTSAQYPCWRFTPEYEFTNKSKEILYDGPIEGNVVNNFLPRITSPSRNVDVGEKIGDLLDIQSGGAQAMCQSYTSKVV